jgi:hypothetical protein
MKHMFRTRFAGRAVAIGASVVVVGLGAPAAFSATQPP